MPIPIATRHCVHQRTARGLAEHVTRKRACRERQANLILRPAQIGEVKSNEGAESGLDIGEEEIHPVEAALLRREIETRINRRPALPVAGFSHWVTLAAQPNTILEERNASSADITRCGSSAQRPDSN
jgi:hypothetical protein